MILWSRCWAASSRFRCRRRGRTACSASAARCASSITPTIKYTVELSLHSKSELGAAENHDPHPVPDAHRAAGRLFLPLLADRAAVYPRAVPRGDAATIRSGQGALYPATFRCSRRAAKTAEIGTAIAAYIQMIDRALKGCLGARQQGSGTASSKKFI